MPRPSRLARSAHLFRIVALAEETPAYEVARFKRVARAFFREKREWRAPMKRRAQHARR
jgi:hypothetical protein